MTARSAWRKASTRSVTLGGNEAVLLDGDRGDRSALFVESGSIALFGVDVRDGVPAGPRRMLHRIGSGQAVFRAPVELEHRLRFVIVPIQDAVIREAPLAALWGDRGPGCWACRAGFRSAWPVVC